LKVHELRDAVDAILVGSRTVMLDDPSLTTRLPERAGKDPVRVILDSADYLDQTRKVFQNESDAPTWVAVSEAREIPGAAEVITVGTRESGLDFVELMRRLGQREIMSVLIEGGGTTHASAFEAGVVDKVMFFVAPKIVGGRDAISAVEGAGVELMTDAIELTGMTATPVGVDLLIEAYVKRD
jgi:diaminohydroxyphosphoribosylaminopyrimidine deaminase/5-amino-6-(5-phosphoribosylamino)uracil reductase